MRLPLPSPPPARPPACLPARRPPPAPAPCADGRPHTRPPRSGAGTSRDHARSPAKVKKEQLEHDKPSPGTEDDPHKIDPDGFLMRRAGKARKL